jgi:uncharacterized damage-inducible protein DinB
MMDALAAELDQEAALTRRLLERVPNDKLEWRPHAKSTPLGKLAMHIAVLPGRFGSRLHDEGFDTTSGQRPPEPVSADQIVKVFDEGVEIAKRAISTLDDAKAMGSWTLSAGPKALVTRSRAGIIRMLLLSHSVHHRGQLSVYLRILDVPLPSIYGPSADENPFA